MNRSTINSTTYTSTGVLNVFLVAAVMFLLIYYVLLSNSTTSSKFKVGVSNETLASLMESNGALTAQKLLVEDSQVLLDFAHAHYMVETKYVAHVFENNEVALQP